MKKFKFRLERVLQYRLMLKDEKRRVLLMKNMSLHEAREHLQTLEEAERSNGLSAARILPAREIYLIGLYGQRLKDEIVDQRLRIIGLEDEVSQAMLEYTEAARDAKTLEIFKERKLQEYMDYMAKEDGKFLDELAVQRGNKMFREQGDVL